ncbi:tRNA (guanosine(46)-N7)-methyltransferase TrmB [Nodosilinea sp. E11]|uniref:tRNA (guanosine(46)-N7)-methyltransferase TrmB n=1 Tax=Nodosilinea sp. E11 TaxID=3037479 RepID=UPI002934245F|nr:tRNA (guanosine(46)-N7)-methyltransferase TrmB [Nodosilinea sp. E11]WOD38382.1 tRNA (guanosine(46)-N7)-methyltransferase TrmB [Nodosilinea sp. E11]
MAVVRVRQHVNPLSERYQAPVETPAWETLFANPQQPLHIDIGCGKGVFALHMAQLQPEWNFLGLEIRRPVVESAQKRQQESGLSNLHFMYCNVNISLRALLESWGDPNPLQQVSIQFPDPWFKKRHQKRRVLQPELVATLAEFLPSGGRVVVQSDVEAVAIDMCDRIAENPHFLRSSSDWLPTSPFPAQTDRERVTLEQGLPVHRAIFTRS